MSKFVSNTLKLFSATILGQILGLIVMPFLSRLYTPADFGVYQLFFSMVAVVTVFSCFSYSSAINLPEKHEDAANIVVLCVFLIIVTSIITTVFFLIFAGYIDNALNTPGFSNYFLLLPLAIISNSFAYILSFWLSRREQFGTIAKANILSSITGKTVSVGSGILSPSPFGLIFGTIINDTTIFLVFLRRTAVDFPFLKEVTFRRMGQLALRYKKFPQYDFSAKLVGAAAGQSAPLLLAFFFSPVIVGYYAMSGIIINLPLKLIGNSFSSVFYQKICAEKNLTGNIKNIVKSVHTRLISLGMFGCLIGMIIGPELFAFVLGDKWLTAGVYAQILMPSFFVLFISVPLLSIINVAEKQDIFMWFNIYSLISTVSVLIIGGYYHDPIIVMILASFSGVVSWSWMNIYTLKIAGIAPRETIEEIIRYLVFGLFFCLPLLFAKYFLAYHSKMLILVAAIMSLIYYLIIIYRDTELKQGLVNFVADIRQK
jgi:O-antigen/teichoic acid export membrane protein